jgi:hypothetical protein
MRSNEYHCCGCERLIEHCEFAFRPGSEKCELYVRSSFHNCHKCQRFGQDCQRSGLVRCVFLPRITEDPFEKINEMKETGNER